MRKSGTETEAEVFKSTLHRNMEMLAFNEESQDV